MTAFDDLRKKHDALLDAAYSVQPEAGHLVVYHSGPRLEAKQYTGANVPEMRAFVGPNRWRLGDAGVYQAWNSLLRQWLNVREESWVIRRAASSSLDVVTPALFDLEYSTKSPTSSLSSALAAQSEIQSRSAATALSRVRSAQIRLENLGLMARGLRNALLATDRQFGDQIQAFKAAGRDDADTRARDHFRDLANGLLSIVREMHKDINEAGNEIQAAAGSLRR